MPEIIKNNSGTYLLEIFAPVSFRTGIKRFSGIIFPAGYYYYSGSAQKNLYARIERHKRKNKILHWHIDHITCREDIIILSVSVFTGGIKARECKLVSELKKEFNLDDAAAGFGNSDCSSCSSHLLYSKRKISHSHFMRLYHSTVRFIPS